MRSVRQRNNQNEMMLRSALYHLGARFRVHKRIIPGHTRTADVVFARIKVAVFVDGCFWHSCPRHNSLPKANRGWWKAKLAANVKRDRHSDLVLRRGGWRVIRVWEHEDVENAARRILKIARSRRSSMSNQNSQRAPEARQAELRPRSTN
jgi:DNA mismatch endonuclease (patch repair protein)